MQPPHNRVSAALTDINSHAVMRAGLLTVSGFVVGIVALHILLPENLPLGWTFDPPLLAPVLNTIFTVVMPLAVAYIACRSYLVSGSLNVLLLSSGVFTLGCSMITATWLQSAISANVGVTIHNIGVLSASFFHMAGVLATLIHLPAERNQGRRKKYLAISLLGILSWIVLLATITLQGRIPPFVIDGAGFSTARQVVLGSAVHLFIISGLFFFMIYLREKIPLLFWYALALLLFGIGLFGVWMQRSVGDPIGWAGRSAQMLSGVYFLSAALLALRRARVTSLSIGDALSSFFHESELSLKNLIETVPDAIISVDSQNRVLLWNSSAEVIFGYKREEAVGFPLNALIGSGTVEEMLQERSPADPETTSPRKKPAEVTAKRKNGEQFPTEFTVTPRLAGDDGIRTFVMRDVTGRKEVEEKLRESETRQRAIFDALPSAVFVKDLQGRYLFCNQQAELAAGKPLQEILGKTDRELFPSDAGGGYGELEREALEAEKPVAREVSFPLNDGIRTHMIVNFPLLGTDGRPYAVAGVSTDITQRKRAEETLRESEERYRMLFERMQEAFSLVEVVTDQAGNPVDLRYLSVNPALERNFRRSREEIVGHTYREVIPNPDPEWISLIGRVAFTGEPVAIERYSRATGHWVEVHAYSPRFGYCAVVTTQITKRKRIEEELHRSRNELEIRVQERTAEIKKQAELIELSHDAILVMDLENRILFWNKGAEKVYGWRKEEVLGKITHAVLQTRFPVRLGEIMAKLMEKGGWDGELSQFRRDGQKITVLSRWAVQRDESGRAIAILETNSDITERKKVEEQLRQAQKMEALGTLAGGIAHDFNNLLMPILLNTEMALLDIKAGVLPSADAMEVAIAGANRGKELVQQIITFSRHKGEDLKPIDIAPITKETIKFLRSAIPATIRFETRIEDPSSPVLANPTQIHQILMNLVNNAASSMEEEGGVLEISLEKGGIEGSDGIEPGGYVRVTVKDTGHGMAPEVKERAFDPFFTTKAPGKGTGMGLAVVHGIVKKHGGEIRLESEVGKGTTVTVSFPVYEGAKTEEHSSPTLGSLIGNETVLFIDDEEVQTRSVEAMLQRLGYQAVAETDPRKALDIFRSRPDKFDLVITDQVMPYLPGNRLAQELLSIRPDIPIILCTGFSETVDEETADDIGVREFVMKPFSLEEIAKAIRRVLNS